MLLGLFEGEAARVQNLVEWQLWKIRFDQLRVEIDRAHDLSRQVEIMRRGVGDFVHDNDVGELNLLDQKIDQRTVASITCNFATIS